MPKQPKARMHIRHLHSYFNGTEMEHYKNQLQDRQLLQKGPNVAINAKNGMSDT